MNEPLDPKLEALLKETGRRLADGAVCPSGLAGRVERLRRRRRRNRRVAGAAIAVAVVATIACVALVHWNTEAGGTGATAGMSSSAEDTVGQANRGTHENELFRTPSLRAAEPAGDTELRAELAQLKAEVEQLREAIERIRRQDRHERRMAELRRQTRGPDAEIAARCAIEKTAFWLVERGRYQEAHPRPGGDPTVAYRQAVEEFPETAWARVAEQRLAELAGGNRPESPNNTPSSNTDPKGDH